MADKLSMRNGAALRYDAVIVGAGPNGLAAAITIAKTGRRVVLVEANAAVGGGVRSEHLTLPGVVHDVCSSVFPMGAASPVFRTLPLARAGVDWVAAPIECAHPFDDGDAAVLMRSVDDTAASLNDDGRAYRRLFEPFVRNWDALLQDILAPIRMPQHPLLMARFGLRALRSATGIARSTFRGERAKALLAGLAAHSIMPIDRAGTASFALVLGAAGHVVGWPFVRGGAQALADGLASVFNELGGEIRLDTPVNALAELPAGRSVLLDLSPREVVRIAGTQLPSGYRRALERFRPGPGVFKMDWALSEPVPWRDPQCRRAGTLHLGGSLDEIAISEAAPFEGRHADRPFLIAAQPTLFDPTRAPAGVHTLWAYCHVPNGSSEDMTSRIEAQIERFAPGFRDVILARYRRGPAAFEGHNRNLTGGDIGGGENSLRQVLFRPTAALNPYRLPIPGAYLCSASTPPGGGVHGLCGFHAAQAALRRL